MLKMIINSQGQFITTNDGNTIVRELDLDHPVAKSLVHLSQNQEDQVGDGTTSIVIYGFEILKTSEVLLNKGFHPNQIIGAYHRVVYDCLKFLDKSLKFNLVKGDYGTIKRVLLTCIGTKLIKKYSRLVCDICINLLRDSKTKDRFNPIKENLHIEKIYGSNTNNCKAYSGCFVKKDVAHEKMRKNIKNPRIALFDCSIEFRKLGIKSNVQVNKEKNWNEIVRKEEEYILYLCKILKAHKLDLILCEKNVSDLALHYLNKTNISVIKRVKKTENLMLSRQFGINIMSSIESMTEEDLIQADTFNVIHIDGDVFSFFGNKRKYPFFSVILRGPTKDIVDEIERNLFDAIDIAETIYRKNGILPGAGCSEIFITNFLNEKSNKFSNQNFFVYQLVSSVFESIPKILAENCGKLSQYSINALKNKHSKNRKFFGLDAKNGCLIDTRKFGLYESFDSKARIIKASFENISALLRIDTIINETNNNFSDGS